jgi:GNAT superfamily N-acetyltransferase
MPTLIAAERPDTVEAATLIRELDAYLKPLYPPASHHGLPVEQLLREGVAFFVMRYDGLPAGCGGIQFFGTAYGEIKRMYVRPAFRGLGLGKLMLQHLADSARLHGVTVLRLETGIYQPEAIGLYKRCGFRRIPPFGAYQEDPLSVFYEKCLTCCKENPPSGH